MRGGAPILLGARPVKEEERRHVPASSLGDRLRPEVERGICTDALVPGQTVREDDRPCAGTPRLAATTSRRFPGTGWPRSPLEGGVSGSHDLFEQVGALVVADERAGERSLGHGPDV